MPRSGTSPVRSLTLSPVQGHWRVHPHARTLPHINERAMSNGRHSAVLILLVTASGMAPPTGPQDRVGVAAPRPWPARPSVRLRLPHTDPARGAPHSLPPTAVRATRGGANRSRHGAAHPGGPPDRDRPAAKPTPTSSATTFSGTTAPPAWSTTPPAPVTHRRSPDKPTPSPRAAAPQPFAPPLKRQLLASRPPGSYCVRPTTTH